MITVKVHEWCLVCFRWMALCFCNNFHLAFLFISASRLHFLERLWFPVLPTYVTVLFDYIKVVFHRVSSVWRRMNLEAASMIHLGVAYALTLWLVEFCLVFWMQNMIWVWVLRDPCFALVERCYYSEMTAYPELARTTGVGCVVEEQYWRSCFSKTDSLALMGLVPAGGLCRRGMLPG